MKQKRMRVTNVLAGCLVVLGMLSIIPSLWKIRSMMDDHVGDYFWFAETLNAERPPLTCDLDFEGSRKVIDNIVVAAAAPPNSFQRHLESDLRPSKGHTTRILCFLMTHSNSHATRVEAVMETWGRKCDGWLVASNTTDPEYYAVTMNTPATYTQLWPKLNETLHYVYHHLLEDFDWFFKVDDDTFVLMENLQQFLRSQSMEKERMRQPLIFGYMLQDQIWRDQQVYFHKPGNQAFGEYFLKHVRNASSHVDYLAGGSGYVMNKVYLERLIQALHSNLTLHGIVPEDMAQTATMLAHGIAPQNSRDTLGRDYFIPESPQLWQMRHARLIEMGVLLPKSKCCTSYTISFHHIDPRQMHYLYDQFYHCRASFTMI